MIVENFRDIKWDRSRWPNFSAEELACRHCGELWWDPVAFDVIQQVRENLGSPVDLNCAHRCIIHNAHVGGAPRSQHKQIAFDISIRRTDPTDLLRACARAGLSTFGFYRTFLHTDLRQGRRWFSKGGREVWISAISSVL